MSDCLHEAGLYWDLYLYVEASNTAHPHAFDARDDSVLCAAAQDARRDGSLLRVQQLYIPPSNWFLSVPRLWKTPDTASVEIKFFPSRPGKMWATRGK